MPEFDEAHRLTLEFDLDAEPIAGRVYFQEDEVVLPFSGWIGLITAIETAGTPRPDVATAPGAIRRRMWGGGAAS